VKKLKILYHHRVAAQDGQSVHIHELTRSFKEMGHELIFVGPYLRPKEFGKESRLVDFVRMVLPQFAQEILELVYGYHVYYKLYRAYKEHKPDILYERHNLFLPAGAKLKKKTGIPYLLEVNAPLTEERSKYSNLSLQKVALKMEVATWKAADMALPVTNVLANYMRSAGVENSKIMTLHNGINHKDYETLDHEKIRTSLGLQGKTVLGFTGFLREWHRLDMIIKLIASFDKDTSPHLLVVGHGPAMLSCQNLAKELKIEDRVHFVGFVDRDMIPLYIAAMDITLQPAVTEYASPLKIFEYMVAGTAIVAPDQENIREIVTHREDTLLFDVNNPSDAGNKILELINDPELRNKIGLAAKKNIDEKGYTWRSNAEKITHVANQLLDRQSPSNSHTPSKVIQKS